MTFLSKRRDILDALRQRFSYILIDEFQDINLVQYKTIQLLAAPKNNLLSLAMMISRFIAFAGKA